ncbi:g1988 [Coccomyxa viridis]|uniref:G1988 protein n=1 Tax=Coccomyxa viridis TaxID=1274662 RepID=A0ABP1FM87_9CHLO
MTTSDLLPCQRDCYARESQATVLRCDPAPTKESQGGRFKLELTSSPLYPESGGQPGDRGRLYARDGKVLADIIDVQRESNAAVAVYTNAAVPSQTEVLVRVDWQHRYDLMQQHTGQHLLSAVCDEVAGADTVSWELHPLAIGSDCSDSVCIDLAVPQLSSQQLQAIEERCNEVIRSGVAVRQVIVSEENRQAVASSKILRGALPPPDRVNGPVRMIEIEGVDINACGGTHLHSASEIQAIKIKSIEKTKGMLRLRFIAGGRVFAAMGRYLAEEAALNKALGCGLSGWSRAVQKIQADRKQLSKRIAAYSAEVAHTYAQSILPQLLINNGWLHSHREDADAEFLSTVAAAVMEASPGAMVFLTGGNMAPGRHHKPAEKVFLLSGPKDKVGQLGPQVAEALSTKGGGRPGAFQGKMSGLNGLPEALKILHQSWQPSRTSIGCAPTSGFVGTQPMLTPISGGFVGTQPMLEPIGGAFAGTQAMLVPMAAPAPLPPVLPTLRGSAAEVELLANVELAEQRLWEFNVMYDEQRQKLLNEEQGALDIYRCSVGDVPTRPLPSAWA